MPNPFTSAERRPGPIALPPDEELVSESTGDSERRSLLILKFLLQASKIAAAIHLLTTIKSRRSAHPISLSDSDSDSDSEQLEAGIYVRLRRPVRRHRRGSIAAVLFIFAVILIVVLCGKQTKEHNVAGDDGPEDDEVEVPGPSTGNLAEDPRLEPYQTPENAQFCADWIVDPEHPTTASVEFDLPFDDDKLTFFLARTAGAEDDALHGKIQFQQDTNGVGVARVAATVHLADMDSDSNALLRGVKVCRMGSEEKREHGVLFWASLSELDQAAHLEVSVLLPPTPEGTEPNHDLTTDLPLFIHELGSLFTFWGMTVLQSIRLRSTNAAISSGVLVASQVALIQTSNASVDGWFWGRGLRIATTNGTINSTIVPFNEVPGSETQLDFRTSNGDINVAIFASLSPMSNNTLAVSAHTSNGNLTIHNGFDSRDATLRLDASTTAGSAEVRVGTSFEGTYELETTDHEASVVPDPDTKDPLGKDRTRVVTREDGGEWPEKVHGEIYWAQDGQRQESGEPLQQYGLLRRLPFLLSIPSDCTSHRQTDKEDDCAAHHPMKDERRERMLAAPICTNGKDRRCICRESKGPTRARNSDINVGLFASLSPMSNNTLAVSAHTSNGNLTIHNGFDSRDARLRLDASTTGGSAEVRVGTSFEGTYELETTDHEASVVQDPDTKDPLGKDRTRVVTREDGGRKVKNQWVL
ncbi:hypothetical protein C8F01DRAFT_1250381 [Mycena amicta]|nr:hypothetical protein C8F01DRAFT_1250381 [Mycena amicta]